MDIDSGPLLVSDDGPVRTITFNRPELHNAQNEQMLELLDHVLDQTSKDESVRLVILTGAGRSFSSGHDLREIHANPQYARNAATAEGRFYQEQRLFVTPVDRFRSLPMPTLCVVRGYCLAAGLMFVASADFVIAHQKSVFGSPIVTDLGVADAEVFVAGLRLGERRAKQLMWLNDQLDAAEALRFGLVNWVEPDDELVGRTQWVIDRILRCPPETLRLTKLTFRFAADRAGERDVNAFHFLLHQLSHHTSESKEILDARLESIRSGGSPVVNRG
jgi:enoyl-CoA hydratase